jgi:predicted DNA-binding protein (UPF0251 family)
MPRPRKDRNVHEPPLFTEFKPLGIKNDVLDSISLSLDEFEAIRLADFVGMAHEEASEEMGVSRSTFSRLVDKSRQKVAEFILKGKRLRIEGGNIHFSNNILKCTDCGHMFKIKFNSSFSLCPECQSNNLLSLAGGFGHGECCRNKNEK